ncbi:kinesin-like protein KIN-14U isoform X2 [Macadamia integrifolia]|nr:kinesin-like protein KIN-14U isoform X2 [Macadamia integrifolia]XP_042516392.1 kinesin-like protein KIN-14U isoform X2 [Macadamia integrifolia]XP_042516394.1 kinesin-like protein KIN-14U isoform X2 [Macadamia integrifolia]XP_042516395.1 kinesin-like protein KIN-14U isoform X2 [Macadamia integrifolia]
MEVASHLCSNPDSFDGFPPVSGLPISPPTPAVYMDVNVVPEHEKEELQRTILNLEGDIVELRSKLRSLDEKRRGALNKILDLKGSIRVFCRVRPFQSTNMRRTREPISTESDKIVVRSAGSRKEYGFDKVFTQEASQEDVFVEVEPIIRSALDGHNVCILAYGQTGTGKTFTMEGSNDQLGIVPRALEELFCQTSQDSSASFHFSMSMLEVYKGSLRDLLAPKPSARAYETSSNKCNLNIQTDPNGAVEIEKLTDVTVSDFAQANRWYTKGRRARSTSWTNVNEASSRSHCLTRVTIGRSWGLAGGKTEVSKLWMVDLGGSERLLKTGAAGQTLDEGKAINLSLSALADVIAALKRKLRHIPYRNSKLTQILKDSLGDGSKALMLVHISPCEEDVGETTSSLNFARRVRAIVSSRECPEELKKQQEKRMFELHEEMREAEEECQKLGNKLQKAEFLLHENKKLFSTTYRVLEHPDELSVNHMEDLKEVIATPRTADRAVRKNISSFPRFMTSTVASRQRYSAADGEINARTNGEINGRARISRLGARSSIQFTVSQSLSYSDAHFKVSLRNSNKKSRHGELKNMLTESPDFNGLESRTSSTPQYKRVTSSNPTLRVMQCHHRRRMSDLI